MKEEIKKTKKSLSLTISIVVFLALIFGAAYALIGANIIYDGSNITAALGSRPIFVSDASNQITLEIPYLAVEADEEYIISNGTGSVNISLTTNYDEYTKCDYDIYWMWDKKNDTKNQYKITSGATKEYTISGTDGKDSFTDVQLNDYNANNLKTLLHSGYIIASAGSLATQTWDITANFYKTKAVQSAHAGAAYSGKVVIENVVCSKMTSLSDTVLALESTRDYASSQDGTTYRVANQNGVRYEGKNPDNYVTYNGNELWRIIGVFDGSDIGLEAGKKYTKIIRSTPLDTLMAWDDNENDWHNSTLKNMLNNDYLNSTGAFVSTATDKGLSAQARGMIAQYNDKYSTWYLRGPESYSTLTSDGWYNIERTTGIAGYSGGTTAAAKTTTQAAIGLMYPSDYGYAMYGGANETTCINTSTKLGNGGYINCEQYDWLFTDQYQWTVTPWPTPSITTFTVYWSGYVDASSVANTYAARPTLYLEADVVVASGDGSEESPYELYKEYNPTYLSDAILAKAEESAGADLISETDGSVYRLKDEAYITPDGTAVGFELRYEGKNPDNYVIYNNEEWRIIGVFDGRNINLEPDKKYTKIIKSTPLDTTMAWDNDNGTYENDWENSTLNAYLNSTYLNSLTTGARGQIATYNGKYSLWHLQGPTILNNQALGYYSQDWHYVEVYPPKLGTALSSAAGYRNGNAGFAATSIQAAIGLMYPSDYGFAAYGSTCDNRSSMPVSSYSNGCSAVDWLFSGEFEWLISPDSGGSDQAFAVIGAGGQVLSLSINNGSAVSVRPVLYLDSSVTITGGTGQKGANAYKLG